MKKIALTATALAAILILPACSSNDKHAGCDADSTDCAAVEGVTNIRFYDLDSVSANYKLVEKLNSDAEASMARYQQAEKQRSSELQSMANKIQEKLQSGGYITEQSYNADMQNLQKKQAEAEKYLAGLQQQIAQQAAAQQKELIDSLDSFLATYNAVHNYDAILVKQPGQYSAPSLDITDDVIEGLNARYVK